MWFHGRPHRPEVRTSRCGRDDPGSTPGVDIHLPIRYVLQCSLRNCLRTRQNTIDKQLAPAPTKKQTSKGPH